MAADQRAAFVAQVRRRGRPPINKIPVRPTSVRVPDPVFEALCRIATRERVSLHRLMNTALVSYVREQR